MLLTRKRIGILMGGQSAERAISLKTGRAVHAALRRRGYDAVAIDVTAEISRTLRARKVHLAFVALHGPGGEDGAIQGLLELMRIPYTGSGVLTSAVAMHKESTKIMLAHHGIPVPAGRLLRRARPGLLPRSRPAGLSWPVIVKPASQGSTIGVSIVRRAGDWNRALRRALAHDDEVLIEAYVPGREVTVSVLSGVVLPAVEIVAPDGFYDFAAKYQKGRTRYLCPAPLPASTVKFVSRFAKRAYDALGCEGAARVDFRVPPRGRPVALEVNTVPGMTETSLLPLAAARAGLDYDGLTERILESALVRARRMGVKT